MKGKLRNIDVSGYTGPLLSTANVSGSGLQHAVAIDPPKLPKAIIAEGAPYQLH